MKQHIMLFESFINEGRKLSKEVSMRKLKHWAEGDFIILKKEGGKGFWSEFGYFPDGKNSVGSLVAAAAGDNQSYYFDDADFVKGDKTIIPVKVGYTTTKMFYDKLVELGIIKD